MLNEDSLKELCAESKMEQQVKELVDRFGANKVIGIAIDHVERRKQASYAAYDRAIKEAEAAYAAKRKSSII